MILNNYWIYKNWAESTGWNGLTAAAYSDNYYKTIDGEDMQLVVQNSNDNIRHNICIKDQLSARVGTGTTEPTANDYRLGTDVMSSLSNVVTTCNTSSSDDNKVVTVITISGVNNTNSTLELTEIGVTKTALGKVGGGIANHALLFIRSLLETPKVVAPGEGFFLTFEWVES